MSANKPVPEHQKYLLDIVPSEFLLDGVTTIEAHVRINPPQQKRGATIYSGTMRERFHSGAFAAKPKPGTTQFWRISSAHPYGWNPRGGQVEVNKDGHAPIPTEFANHFDSNRGVVMSKVVTVDRPGYLAVPGQYRKTLWTNDPDEAPRQHGPTAGKFGYSIPLHKLQADAIGGPGQFFFVIVVDGDEDRASLKVFRVQVTRGKDHFHFAKSLAWETKEHGNPAQIPVAEIKDVLDREMKKDPEHPLRDLPVKMALLQFQAGLYRPEDVQPAPPPTAA